MKRFLTKIIYFFILLIVTIVAFWSVLTINRQDICTTDATTIICGNSTVEYGVNDRLMDCALNVGFNAEHIEYIYAKIKLLTKYNPGIKRILIGVDDALLFKNHEEEHNHALHHFFYYDQYDFEDIKKMVRCTSFDWWSSYLSHPFQPLQLITPIRSMLGSKCVFKDLGVGGYEEMNKIMENIDVEEMGVYSDNYEFKHADIDLELYFLKKIQRLCQEKNIDLIFFSTPKYGYNGEDKFIDLIRQNFPTIQLLDFSHFPMDEVFFADSYHLNSVGSKKFVQLLTENL